MTRLDEIVLLSISGRREPLSEFFPGVLLFAHGDCPTSPLALRRLEGVSKGVVLVRGEACRGARVARQARVGFQTLAQSADLIASQAFQVETVPTAGTKRVHERDKRGRASTASAAEPLSFRRGRTRACPQVDACPLLVFPS